MEEADNVLKSLEDTVVSFGGSVLNVEKMGRKRLAFDVKKFKDGLYVNYKIELPEDKVKDLKRFIKLNDGFLRDMLVSYKEKAVAEAK